MQALYINNQLRTRGFLVNSIDFTQLEDRDEILEGLEYVLKKINESYANLTDMRAKLTALQNQNTLDSRQLNHYRFQLSTLQCKLKSADFEMEVLDLEHELQASQLQYHKTLARQGAIEQKNLKLLVDRDLKFTQTQLNSISTASGGKAVSAYATLESATPTESPPSPLYDLETKESDICSRITFCYNLIWESIPDFASALNEKREPTLDNLSPLLLGLVEVLQKKHMQPKNHVSIASGDLIALIRQYDKELDVKEKLLDGARARKADSPLNSFPGTRTP